MRWESSAEYYQLANGILLVADAVASAVGVPFVDIVDVAADAG